MKIQNLKQTFKIVSLVAIFSLNLTGCNALHTPKNVNFLAFENPVNSPETVEWIKTEKSK